MIMKNGNMYDFTETWNPLSGQCSHKCTYCYVEVMKKRYETHMKKYSGVPRLDDNAMKLNLYNKKYKGKTIFVCSCNDLFADNVPFSAIEAIINKTKLYPDNRFFFQTKNSIRILKCLPLIPKNSIICTTMENDRNDLSEANKTYYRAWPMAYITGFEKHITIEPIVKFDLKRFVDIIKFANVQQVNIGADSKSSGLIEPTKSEVLALITELIKFTKVHLKSNLNRIIK